MTFLFHAATSHPTGFYYWNVYLEDMQFVCEELYNRHAAVTINPEEIGVDRKVHLNSEIDNIKDSLMEVLASKSSFTVKRN